MLSMSNVAFHEDILLNVFSVVPTHRQSPCNALENSKAFVSFFQKENPITSVECPESTQQIVYCVLFVVILGCLEVWRFGKYAGNPYESIGPKIKLHVFRHGKLSGTD